MPVHDQPWRTGLYPSTCGTLVLQLGAAVQGLLLEPRPSVCRWPGTPHPWNPHLQHQLLHHRHHHLMPLVAMEIVKPSEVVLLMRGHEVHLSCVRDLLDIIEMVLKKYPVKFCFYNEAYSMLSGFMDYIFGLVFSRYPDLLVDHLS